MPKLTINDREIEVPEGYSILQAAEEAGFEIPVFCYHPKLSVAGNCRMCLVDVERSPKPVASCAMPVSEGMVVRTNTPAIEKARKGVLEFLLINHPLDCPICDQGGECDLQDITVSYGRDFSRYDDFPKRAVKDKDIGPLIETAMNRCIHCTRCVRFSTEIAGVQEMGTMGRGEHMEIGTYLSEAVASELSGNMIDICPVGALMSKPYSYRGRPWELSRTSSVDVMDAVGSSIRIDSRGREVMRILPRLNEDVNEEWISDKSRFAYDGLKFQRLDRPYVRNAKGQLQQATWDQAFDAIAARVKTTKPDHMAALVGNMADCESIVALKDLMTALGSPHMDCRQEGSLLDANVRSSYIFNTTIAGIESADFILIVGANPRWEAPLVNARIRKNYLRSGLEVALLGADVELGYPKTYLGNEVETLNAILSGDHKISKKLKSAKRPLIIVGEGGYARADGQAIIALCQEITETYGGISEGKERWNGFNVLHTAAARVGGLDLGFVPGKGGKATREILKSAEKGEITFLYLLGADECAGDKLEKTFVVYQGHHGDAGAAIADVILPGCAYTEKHGTYVNTEGRVQVALQAVAPPGEAKEDWKILRALSDKLGCTLPYDTLKDVRGRLVEVNSLFEESDVAQKAKWQKIKGAGKIKSDPFVHTVQNFYMTDVISRNSITMATCTRDILGVGADKKRTGSYD